VSTNLNLASKPFNNRVLPWTLTVLILFISMVGLVFVVRFTTDARAKAAAIEAETNSMRSKEQSLLEAADVVKKSFTADQLRALQAAHELVDRKSFSWMRLLTDLEGSLPQDVKVSRIAVRNVRTVDNQTVAELDLAVFAKSPNTVTDMMGLMQKAGVFEAELRDQNLQKGRGEGGTEYVLFVIYRPRAGYATESVAEVTALTRSSEVQK
jgi:Tfp pilus assembly protein PilN